MVSGRSSGAGTNPPLSEHDLNNIKAKVQGVVALSGQLWASATVVRGNTNTWTLIWGVHDQYLRARNWQLDAGREITEQEVAAGKRVALIGQTVVKALFGDDDPMGQTIRIRDAPFTVIGVLSTKGRTAFGGDHDDTVLVPMTAARRQVVGKNWVVTNPVGQIAVKFEDDVNLADAKEEIEQLLRQTRRIPPGADDNFVVGNLAESMKARTEAQTTLSLLLGVTAAISLAVGGIGIMNIMLVSVTERTREIGLRMAVGARRFDIMLQFLIEAVTLCMIGGLIGIVLGIGAASITARLAAWPILIAPQVALLAIAAAASTGILFGFLPARRAARLNPIDALRSE
jgi:putative ABC transport system permease protein